MTETVTSAVARKDNGPGALIARYSGDFATVLPSHVKPETWVRVAQGVLRRDENLLKAAQRNPGSFMAALLDCARLGLEPGTEQYYLVPFGSEVTGIVGYQGEIELIYRAGAVSSIKAEVVRSGDTFTYRPDMERPDHQPDWFGARGELVGVYAYAVMRDGSTSRVVVLGRDEIERHRAMSRGWEKSTSPWQKWTESMWLKTAVHELAKWVPTSAEYRREQLRAAVEADNLRRPAPPTTSAMPAPAAVEEPVDAEIVDADADAMQQAAEEETGGWPDTAPIPGADA